MDNYIKVIMGIKYDTGQAKLVCEGIHFKKRKADEQYKNKMFGKKVLISTNIITTKLTCKIMKGTKGGFFIYIVEEHKTEKENESNKEVEIIQDYKLDSQRICPISQEEAIDHYFNGFNYHTGSTYWETVYLKMVPIATEEEAFEGIPVA